MFAGLLLFLLYERFTCVICDSKERLEGKTILVTGGTAGMGLEMSKAFARRGARVIIACPFDDEGKKAEKQIVEETGNANIVYKFLDLASLKSIREFAANILENEYKLNVLVNNAGIYFVPEYITIDGLNLVLQVNYYGHFLLTLLLLPLLKKSGNQSEISRIVNTTSRAHWIGKIDLKNINDIGYSLFKRAFTYANSKLCVMLFTKELSRRLNDENVVVTAIDPGVVATKTFNFNTKLLNQILFKSLTVYCKTPWQGIQTALFASLHERAEKLNGDFLKDCKVYKASCKAYDYNVAASLWRHSEKVVKLTEEELSACEF